MEEKIYFGCAVLEEQDLAETNINHEISIEYYRTEKEMHRKFSFMNKTSKIYGVEAVKKDYYNKSVPYIEKHISEYATKNVKEINSIIEVLKLNKVMPVHMDDIIHDLRQS